MKYFIKASHPILLNVVIPLSEWNYQQLENKDIVFSVTHVFSSKFSKSKFDSALSRTLNSYPILTGRVIKEDDDNLVIIQNNEGVEVQIESRDVKLINRTYIINQLDTNITINLDYDLLSDKSSWFKIKIIELKDGFTISFNCMHLVDGGFYQDFFDLFNKCYVETHLNDIASKSYTHGDLIIYNKAIDINIDHQTKYPESIGQYDEDDYEFLKTKPSQSEITVNFKQKQFHFTNKILNQLKLKQKDFQSSFDLISSIYWRYVQLMSNHEVSMILILIDMKKRGLKFLGDNKIGNFSISIPAISTKYMPLTELGKNIRNSINLIDDKEYFFLLESQHSKSRYQKLPNPKQKDENEDQSEEEYLKIDSWELLANSRCIIMNDWRSMCGLKLDQNVPEFQFISSPKKVRNALLKGYKNDGQTLAQIQDRNFNIQFEDFLKSLLV